MTSDYVNSVFEQPWWLDAVAPDTWEEILIKDKAEIIARWPIVKKGNQVRMPMLTQTLGFWLSADKIESDIHFHERKRIINLLLDQLIKSKRISINLDSDVDYFLPMFWKKFKISPRISYRINDLSNFEKVYNRFGETIKRNIRTASKKVVIKSSYNVEILLELLDKTNWIKDKKQIISKNLIRRLYLACKAHNAAKLIYAVDADNNVYSGILFVYDKNRCYLLISCTDPKYKNSKANSLVIWEGIKFASTVSKIFDFEGSMIENIEHFFRQFGGSPSVYYNITKQSLVIEFYILLKKLLRSMISFKKLLKLKV
jgi:hypothetical protein